MRQLSTNVGIGIEKCLGAPSSGHFCLGAKVEKLRTLITAVIVDLRGDPIDFCSFTEEVSEFVEFSEASTILDKAIKRIDLGSLTPIYDAYFILEMGSLYEREVIAYGESNKEGEMSFVVTGMEEVL